MLDRGVLRGAALFTLIAGVAIAVLPGWRLATTFALVAWAVSGASVFALVGLRPLRGGWLRARTLALEVGIATGPVVIIALLEPPIAAASGAGVGAYFAILVLASLRLDPRTPLATAGVGAVLYALTYLALVRPRLGGAADGLVVERLAWLLLAGALATAATRRVQRQLSRTGEGARERALLEATLGRYVSHDVAEALLKGGAAPPPQRRTVTVMFCDLRGFTFLCERERPEDVVELLNVFYERACAIVSTRGGTVNKLLGDGLLALFGAPHDLQAHADAAGDAALDLMQLVRDLRERGGEFTHLAIGIGLDTGEVVLGPIGSRDRAEYTAIGSPVNRAARLQSLAERENRRIIVSDSAHRAMSRHHRTVSLGMVALKGFAAPEQVFYLADGTAAQLASARAEARDGGGSRAQLTPVTEIPAAPTYSGATPSNQTMASSESSDSGLVRVELTEVDPSVLRSLTQSGELTRLDPLRLGGAHPDDGVVARPEHEGETERHILRRPPPTPPPRPR